MKKSYENHHNAVLKGYQRKLNKQNIQLTGYKRVPRWRQILKAQGLHDNPYANYYYRISLEANTIRMSKSFRSIGIHISEV